MIELVKSPKIVKKKKKREGASQEKRTNFATMINECWNSQMGGYQNFFYFYVLGFIF